MSEFMLLNEHHELVPASMEQWAAMIEAKQHRVASSTVGEVYISTIFLGTNHNWWPNGIPLYFETMIFHGKYDGWMQRWSTWDQAMTGHERVVRTIERGGNPRRMRFA